MEIKKILFLFCVFSLILFGFNLNKPQKDNISDLINDSFNSEITTVSISENVINKIGVKIDKAIIKTKDKLFEKIMQLVG